MVYFTKALHISIYNFKRNLSSIRLLAVLLIIAGFIMQNLEAVLNFSNFVHVKVSPYAFPHLANDYICQLVMMAGAVFIFSNAPYEDDGYFYMLARSGKLPWALGQIFYSIGISLVYVFFLFLLSVLPLLVNMEIGSEWGKIWGTLAKTDAGEQVGLLFSVSEYMVSHYSAVFALFISLLLEFLCISWIGLLVYLLNKFTGKAVGTCAAAFFVLLDICISNDWMNWANRFSPITLAQINRYSGLNLKYQITLKYGILFFVIGILVLSVLCILVNYQDESEIGL